MVLRKKTALVTKNYIIPFITAVSLFIIFNTPLLFSFDSAIYSRYYGDSIGYLRFNNSNTVTSSLDLYFKALSHFLDNISIYNSYHFISWIFTFLSSFLLVKYVISIFTNKTQNQFIAKTIALMFASVITVSPIRLMYSMEWLDHAMWGFIILYFLFSLKWIVNNKIKYLNITAILFMLTFLQDAYHGIMLLLLSPITAAIYFFKNKSLKKTIIFLSLLCIATLPTYFLLNIEQNYSQKDQSTLEAANRNQNDRWAFSARPWHYIIPQITHPIWGKHSYKLHHKIWDTKPYYLTEVFFPKEHTLYLGLSVMLLATYCIYTLAKSKSLNATSTWMIALLTASFLFSMPPFIGYNNLKVYFPSHFIYPFIPQLRVYARFGIIVYIMTATLGAIGAFMLLNKLYKDFSFRSIITIVVLCLIFTIDFINFPPYPILKIQTPAQYTFINKITTTEDMSYIEVPPNKYYTNRLFLSEKSKLITLNPYLNTNKAIRDLLSQISIENLCELEKKYKMQYILFNKYDKQEKLLLNKFNETSIVSTELINKALSSWGKPVWGNHLPRDQKDLREEQITENFKQILTKQPEHFSKVFETNDSNIYQFSCVPEFNN